jgi:hypothetical protein
MKWVKGVKGKEHFTMTRHQSRPPEIKLAVSLNAGTLSRANNKLRRYICNWDKGEIFDDGSMETFSPMP